MGKSKKNQQANGSGQKMAGDVWKTYDVNQHGGAGFDADDLKHLQGQGWRNNDILKVAASSNRVGGTSGNIDRKLSQLNRYLDPKKKDDRKILEQGRSALGMVGMMAANQGQARFLGGDPKKKSSWSFGFAEEKNLPGPTIKGQQGSFKNSYLAGTPIQVSMFNKKGGNIYEWGGRNADGTANALSGIEVQKKGDNWKSRETSWVMPKGMADERFAERVNAVKPAASTAPATGGATAAPALKDKPSFDLGAYTQSSESWQPDKPTFQADTTPTMYQNFQLNQQSESVPVGNIWDNSWDNGEGKRFAASSKFREALDERLNAR